MSTKNTTASCLLPLPLELIELGDKAAADLVTILGTPFPIDAWTGVSQKDLSHDGVLRWALNHTEAESSRPIASLNPWNELAERIANDPIKGVSMTIHSILATLVTARLQQSPYLNLFTILGLCPRLLALRDFLNITAFLEADLAIDDGSWWHRFFGTMQLVTSAFSTLR